MDLPLTAAQSVFLDVLRSAIRGETFHGEIPDRGLLRQILELASEQDVLPMVCEALYRLPPVRENEALFSIYRRKAIRDVVSQTVRTLAFVELCRDALAQGLRPVVVKGIALRLLYPRPNHRPSVDEDLLIPPEEAGKWHSFLLSEGLGADDPAADVDALDEFGYHRDDPPAYIELHKHLFSSSSEAYGDLNELFEGVLTRTVPLRLGELRVWTLSPTDHMLFLVCHSCKHFLHSGIGIRQIADISVFGQAFAGSIDWDRLLEACRSKRLEVFCAALLQICHRYLTLEDMPPAFAGIQADCLGLLEDSLSSGIYGLSDDDRAHSGTMTLEAVAAAKEGRTQRGIWKSLFPGKAYLQKCFPYARSHPALLPAAWVHRLWNYAFGGRKSAARSLQIARERVELLKQYKIIP